MSSTVRQRVIASCIAAVAVIGIVIAVIVLPKDESDPSAAGSAQARNVILLIGDGMGDSEITIGRNYAKGARGRLALDTLPMTGAYTTFSVERGSAKPDYVTDSAAAATGWATGHKTYDGAIGVDAFGRSQTSLIEKAARNGYRTGDVSTAAIQDATPAAQLAHISDRNCAGPEETSAICSKDAAENGGPGSISEQIAASPADIVLGGGEASFQQRIATGAFAGKTVETKATEKGFTIVKTAAELAEIGSERNKRVLGLFADENLDLEYGSLRADAEGTGVARRCETNADRDAEQPHLVDMTRSAIGALDKQSRGQERGFFLQVEGASIDKQDHAADLCGQIGETVAFDAAVAEALAYQSGHPDTLVIVTADHAQTSQIVDDPKTPGVTATVLTKDDAPMHVNYATAPLDDSQQHTGTQVRIAAKGPRSREVTGITDQTELFTTISRALAI